MERFPSGQRGQTVNLLAQSFGGSNPPLSTIIKANDGRRAGFMHDDRRPVSASQQDVVAGVAQLVRASAFQAEGRGFESRFPLQKPA